MHTTPAIGTITALQEMDRKVPDGCSIVGVAAADEGELIIPPLTGLEWSGHDIGHRAAKMLIRQLTGASPGPEQILVRPELQIRRSAAAAPG